MRPLLFLALLLVLALGAAAPAAAQEPARVRPGVSAGGVDLSNLTALEAKAKLDAELWPRLNRDVVLGTGAHPWFLKVTTARLRLDSLRTAQRALVARAPAGGGSGGVRRVEPRITHSRAAVKAFVERVAKRIYRAPRDARAQITLRRILRARGRSGRALDVVRVRARIDAALQDPRAPRVLHENTVVRPRFDTKAMRSAYAIVITIDRAHFRLRLFKRFRVVRSYGVAVGQPAYPTPAGRFAITSKQVNPVWSVPNSPWAGELGGTTVEGGSAANPLKARWMGLAGGVGIHGTGEDWSIGHRASHGCIRMHVSDVVALFGRVPLGTPVLIR
jgi:L,D-transpeptidase catalytic domain/Putative peptidoglycan binding domain